MPSSADQAKTIIVPPLKYICLSSYLAFLESACAGNIQMQPQSLKSRFPAFIQLRMNPNPMFKRLTSSMLPVLKNHLETTLSGACFSALRPALILIWLPKLSTGFKNYSSHCHTGSKCWTCSSPESFQVPLIRTPMQVCEQQKLKIQDKDHDISIVHSKYITPHTQR